MTSPSTSPKSHCKASEGGTYYGTSEKAYLLLANGKVFEGYSFGAQGKTIGEVVFTTGVVGFQETLTDPSYCGQIITQTFPLVGNYGINGEDFESLRSYAKGYIVRGGATPPPTSA